MTIRVVWPVLNLYKGDNQFVGISILSALLKKNGIGSEAVEAEDRAIARKLGDGRPTILAFSTPTIYARTYLDLNRRLKTRFSYLAVFGGPHPTYFPEMIREEGVDVICRGEGEETLLDLVDRAGKAASLRDVPNCWVKEGGEITQNPLRPLVDDLDSLPVPDHDIFNESIPARPWQALVVTSRGCPYGCTYCFNHVFRKLYRGTGSSCGAGASGTSWRSWTGSAGGAITGSSASSTTSSSFSRTGWRNSAADTAKESACRFPASSGPTTSPRRSPGS